jgi:hypothetical protein
MFKEYNKADFTQFDSWKKKVELMCAHRDYNIDYDVVENSYNLKDLFEKNFTPRQAVDYVANEIFGE